ncbi:MAG: proton-conducting transporter membrane subunit, partial [Miltoncostaeaceae bacterium]
MRILAVSLPAPLAILVALATVDGVDLPWLLLGTRLEADATGQVFLALAAVVWTVAALALGPVLRDGGVRGRRLASFGAVALAGNLGVAVAQDAVSFYTCFSAMSLATYGLVTARADRAGRRAGRLYIAMAVGAEALLLAGLVMAVRSAGTLDLAEIRAAVAVAPERDLLVALLLAGFGVKAGMIGVHAWLPRAYAAPPLPVAAVLAGALTELGVLGWMRTLPAGEAALSGWGAGMVVAGLAAVAYGLAAGVTRTAVPAVLAYSSIGQIGLMAAGTGTALARPDLAPAALAGVLVLVLHHGIVKATLFIAIGVVPVARPGWPARAAWTAFAVAALALAGAPASGGAAAKEALKTAGAPWWGGVEWALALSALASALL